MVTREFNSQVHNFIKNVSNPDLVFLTYVVVIMVFIPLSDIYLKDVSVSTRVCMSNQIWRVIDTRLNQTFWYTVSGIQCLVYGVPDLC